MKRGGNVAGMEFRCPACGHETTRAEIEEEALMLPPGEWICPECGWTADTGTGTLLV